MIGRIAFIMAALVSSVAHADDAAIARFRNYLPQQIMAMTDAERSNSVPMMYIGAANSALSPYGDLINQAALNALMYNGLADYEAAKKEFQKDLNEPATGVLTVGQLHTLSYRASRLNMPSVNFFAFEAGGTIDADFATVKGTVKIIDERIAYPVNYVKIECFKAQAYCKYRQTILMLPDENSFTNSYGVSDMAEEFYKVTRWTNDQVDATPMIATGCRVNQLSFNFTTKEYFEIARNNTAGDCQTSLGITLPLLQKPRVSQFVDGSDIIAGEFKRISNEVQTYYSSAFRSRVQTLNKSQAAAASTKTARP